MSPVMRKPVFGGSDQVRHQPRAAQALKTAGGDYLCSENKGADQLRGYREGVLRLCFRISKR